jgi:hypothetical protein
MPKIANYLRDEVKAKSVAVIYINNDFGKGGRDAIVKELNARQIKVAADLSRMTITPDKVPGILIEATWDDTGEIDRISFLAEVKDGKQVITQTLPKLKP